MTKEELEGYPVVKLLKLLAEICERIEDNRQELARTETAIVDMRSGLDTDRATYKELLYEFNRRQGAK